MIHKPRNCCFALTLTAAVVAACGSESSEEPPDEQPGVPETAVSEQPLKGG